MAVVTTAGENDFITSKIYEKDPEYNSENREWLQHWIGHAYDATNSVWEWTNDAKSDYTNWGWEYNPDYIDRFYTPTFISPLIPPVEITLIRRNII